jgi:hypothetical protein
MTIAQLERRGKSQLRLFAKKYQARVRAIRRAQSAQVLARKKSKNPNNSRTVNSVVRRMDIVNLLVKPLLTKNGKNKF